MNINIQTQPMMHNPMMGMQQAMMSTYAMMLYTMMGVMVQLMGQMQNSPHRMSMAPGAFGQGISPFGGGGFGGGFGGGGFGVFVFQGIGQTAMDLVLLGTVPTVLLGFAAAITLDALIDSNLFSAGGRQKA